MSCKQAAVVPVVRSSCRHITTLAAGAERKNTVRNWWLKSAFISSSGAALHLPAALAIPLSRLGMPRFGCVRGFSMVVLIRWQAGSLPIVVYGASFGWQLPHRC